MKPVATVVAEAQIFLRDNNYLWFDTYKTESNQIVRDLLAVLEASQVALARYGVHDTDCFTDNCLKDKPCNCGLAEALLEAGNDA